MFESCRVHHLIHHNHPDSHQADEAFAKMNARLTIDEAGRVVIPEPLRMELRLKTGDALDMESTGEEITLHPVRNAGRLTKKQGFWVLQSGQLLTDSETDAVLQAEREERDTANFGNLG